MPPEDKGPELAHDEQMYQRHGDVLSKDQHVVVYSLAYQHGHSAGYGEVEQYYISYVDFAVQLLEADA